MQNIELVDSDEFAVMLDALNTYILRMDDMRKHSPAAYRNSIIPLYRHKAQSMLDRLLQGARMDNSND